MRVVILVPWRTDDGPRAKVWTVCRKRWEALFPDWPIYEGVSPEGPFNRSAAINHAAAQAGQWDVALVIDADVMLPQGNVQKAVALSGKTGKVVWAHRRWRGMSEEATERLTRNDPAYEEAALGEGGITTPEFTADIDLLIEKTTPFSWSCCMAIRRDGWDRLGGFDERFAGWGFEDGATASAAMGLIGFDRIEGDVLNLWHPRLPGAGKADRDSRHRYTAQALVNGRWGMRYMVALRRDYGLTDRPEPSGPEQLARDIANLKAQDAKFAAEQTDEARKPFDDWWPTLDELVEGARAYRAERRTGTVTVIVTSGGTLETWPARKEYLTASLASLTEHVSGPIVQRVVYSDWPEEVAGELAQIAEAAGFYVAGGPHVGYTEMRRRLWRYISKRAAGSHVFLSEDDFLFTRPVDLEPMLEVLHENPRMAQVALLRGAFYPRELEAGGVLPSLKTKLEYHNHRPYPFVTHRDHWTANPSLIRKSITDIAWPQGPSSERVFGTIILRDPAARFAYWGDGEAWIEHLGTVKAGTGY